MIVNMKYEYVYINFCSQLCNKVIMLEVNGEFLSNIYVFFLEQNI